MIYGAGNLHKTTKQFDRVCEVLNTHWARVGTATQALLSWGEAYAQKWDLWGWDDGVDHKYKIDKSILVFH